MFRNAFRTLSALALALILVAAVQAQDKPKAAPVRLVRGTITAVAADKMEITVARKVPKGQPEATNVIKVAADTKLRVVSEDGKSFSPASLKDLTVGLYLVAAGPEAAAGAPCLATVVSAGKDSKTVSPLLRAERAASRAKAAPKSEEAPAAPTAPAAPVQP